MGLTWGAGQDASGGRKSSDWLTQQQLIKRTGRSSEALSKAIDTLVRQRIIEVQSGSGHLLETASQRRQARGRIQYALHPRLLTPATQKSIPALQKSEYRNIHEHVRNSLYPTQRPKTEYGEAAKANGTKEKTKIEEGNRFLLSNDQGNDQTVTASPTALSMHPCPSVQTSLAFFLNHYQDIYNRYQGGTPPTPSDETLGSLAQLLDHQPVSEVVRLLEGFFTSELAVIKRRGHSLEAFMGNIHFLKVFQQS
jgi:hypothetical protein